MITEEQIQELRKGDYDRMDMLLNGEMAIKEYVKDAPTYNELGYQVLVEGWSGNNINKIELYYKKGKIYQKMYKQKNGIYRDVYEKRTYDWVWDNLDYIAESLVRVHDNSNFKFVRELSMSIGEGINITKIREDRKYNKKGEHQNVETERWDRNKNKGIM